MLLANGPNIGDTTKIYSIDISVIVRFKIFVAHSDSGRHRPFYFIFSSSYYTFYSHWLVISALLFMPLLTDYIDNNFPTNQKFLPFSMIWKLSFLRVLCVVVICIVNRPHTHYILDIDTKIKYFSYTNFSDVLNLHQYTHTVYTAAHSACSNIHNHIPHTSFSTFYHFIYVQNALHIHRELWGWFFFDIYKLFE